MSLQQKHEKSLKRLVFLIFFLAMTKYIADKTPFGSPHTLEDDLQCAVLFKTIATNYSPKPPITVGSLVADYVKQDICGCLSKISVRGKKRNGPKFGTIATTIGRSRVRNLKNLVGVHPINSFVRNILTKEWFKISNRNRHPSDAATGNILAPPFANEPLPN